MAKKIDPKYIQPKHIADILAKTEGIKKEVALATVDEIFNFIKEMLADHKNILIPGLGFFWVNEYRKERKYNKKNGAYYWWQNRPSIKFLTSNVLRNELTKNLKGKDK